MRLQELFETKEEDKALIALSSAIYDRVQAYAGDVDFDYDDYDQELIHIGKIGDIADTPFKTLNDVSIDLQSGDPFLLRAIEPGEDIEDYRGKNLFAFYEEDTRTIVLNIDLLDRNRMKTTITHELRHALDEIKSGSYPYDAARYFTPKKKEHRVSDPYSTVEYRARPAEINARFTEVLDTLSKRIPQWYNKLDASMIKQQLSKDFKDLLVNYEIADLFPEKTQSKDYKRLVSRAYDFMQQEIQDVEHELAKAGNTKRATGSW